MSWSRFSEADVYTFPTCAVSFFDHLAEPLYTSEATP